MLINEMKPGDRVEGFFILSKAAAGRSASGKPFLSVTLEDRTGTMEGKVWDYAGPVSSGDTGAVILLKGAVSEFRGAPQMNIDRIRLAADGDEVRTEDLVPTAPMDAEAAWREVEALVDSIEDADYAAVCRLLLERHGAGFRTIPAAKSVHHGFVHGLLMHTLFMLKTADHLAELYGDVLNRSLLLTGTLLHDLAKLQEFNTSSLGLVTDYSVKGNLLGHLVMGAQEAAQAAAELGIPEEKSVLLQHLILSHHGQPEYGAAVVPQCAESEALACIDLLDSRMEIYREALRDVAPGEFSKRIFALEHKVYRHF